MSEPHVTIGGRRIGPEEPPYVVAEMSGNHNGDIGRALALIDAAKAAGADAVKLQTYTADTITLDHDGPAFTVKGGLWDGRRLYELYQEAHTPWDWHERLFDHARGIGIEIFSSPFDPTAVDLLHRLDAPAEAHPGAPLMWWQTRAAAVSSVDQPRMAQTPPAPPGRPSIRTSTGRPWPRRDRRRRGSPPRRPRRRRRRRHS